MKRKLMMVIVVLALILTNSPAQAFLFSSDVKKAKEYIRAGMYPQAIELLNNRINEKPGDADAHFVLGTCYLHQESLVLAEQRFQAAVNLEPKYGADVATEYRKAGDKHLDKGSLVGAQWLYSKAIQYNPGMQSQIAQMCFDRGSASLNKADFDMAAKLDPSYKMKAYDAIMDKADAASDDACLELCRKRWSQTGSPKLTK